MLSHLIGRHGDNFRYLIELFDIGQRLQHVFTMNEYPLSFPMFSSHDFLRLMLVIDNPIPKVVLNLDFLTGAGLPSFGFDGTAFRNMDVVEVATSEMALDTFGEDNLIWFPLLIEA
jgi:hypothetical protein